MKMKKLIMILAIALLGFASCKKDKMITPTLTYINYSTPMENYMFIKVIPDSSLFYASYDTVITGIPTHSEHITTDSTIWYTGTFDSTAIFMESIGGKWRHTFGAYNLANSGNVEVYITGDNYITYNIQTNYLEIWASPDTIYMTDGATTTKYPIN